jgi:hypothetical protein
MRTNKNPTARPGATYTHRDLVTLILSGRRLRLWIGRGVAMMVVLALALAGIAAIDLSGKVRQFPAPRSHSLAHQLDERFDAEQRCSIRLEIYSRIASLIDPGQTFGHEAMSLFQSQKVHFLLEMGRQKSPRRDRQRAFFCQWQRFVVACLDIHRVPHRPFPRPRTWYV